MVPRNPLSDMPLKDLLGAQITRRSVLVRGGMVGLASLVAAPLLAACGGDDDDDDTPAATATSGGGAAATATTGGGAEATATTGGGAGEATATTAAPGTATTGAGGEAVVGGTWTLVLAQEPDTLDAHKSGSYVGGVVHRYIADTLVAKDVDGEIKPGLCESYEVTEDGMTWTFILQEGVTFHDGAVADAAAAKACYDRALDPATVSAVTIGLLGPIDTITAVDATTLEFKHTTPFSVFFDNMAHPFSSVINAEAAAAAGDNYGRNPVCTGPWKLTEWQAAVQMTLERVPEYNWGPAHSHDGAAYIETIVIKFLPEDATRVASFEAGELDQIEIPLPDIERIKENSDFDTIEFYRPGATFFEFNTTKAPFDDVNVRIAMNYAVDREQILDVAMEGYAKLLYGCLPSTIWGYWAGVVDYAYAYDPEKATETFAAAGWELDGDTLTKDGQPFTFTISHNAASEPAIKACQVLQTQLQEYGISMEIQAIEFSTLLTDLKAGNYQMSQIGYAYASPDIVQLWFHSSNIGSGLTLSQYNDPDLDALIDHSRSVADPEQRLQDYQDIQKLIIDAALWVPLWEAATFYGLTKRIAGHTIHPDGHLHLFEAYITDL